MKISLDIHRYPADVKREIARWQDQPEYQAASTTAMELVYTNHIGIWSV